MNRLPLAIAALTALLAVVLWFIATMLERKADEQILAAHMEQQSSHSMRTESGQDGDLEVATTDSDCTAVENDLRIVIEGSKSCRRDSDCAVFDYGYPIECMTSVARSEISSLRESFKTYHESCEYRVYYDCPTGEAQRQAVCRERQCEIELVDVDALTEETIDFLDQRN
jgi:hypothetical protein